jgi:site-specific recombinase XerD
MPLHRAILYVLFTTGIRQSELINLKFEDYTLVNQPDYESGKDLWFRQISFVGKGEKRQTIPLPPITVEVVDKYIDWAKKQGKKFKKGESLFSPTTKGDLSDALSPLAIRYIVKKYVKMVRPDLKVSAHTARATVATSLLEKGVDIYQVSKLLNHASPTTTDLYNKRRAKLKDSANLKLSFVDEKPQNPPRQLKLPDV